MAKSVPLTEGVVLNPSVVVELLLGVLWLLGQLLFLVGAGFFWGVVVWVPVLP